MSAPPTLPGFLGALAPVLNHYGYLAVGGLVLLEDFGVPSPGETVLIAAAVYAGAGQLNIVAVAMVGFVAAVIGDNIGYLIGRAGGRRLVLRYGKYVLLTPRRFHAAEAFFVRHGGKVVAIARFVEGLRQANGIIAGAASMPWRRFLGFNALGATLWVGTWSTLGYVAGTHIDAVYNQARRYELYLVAAAGVLLAVYLTHRLVTRRLRRPHTRQDEHG